MPASRTSSAKSCSPTTSRLLFTRVVAIAERHGRAVKLLVVPATNVFDAVAQTAVRLQAREIVVGESAKMAAGRTGAAARRGVGSDAASRRTRDPPDRAGDRRPEPAFTLGAHAPELSLEDVDRIHRLWLDAVKTVGPEIHHRDIVSAALDSLEHEFRTGRDRAVERLQRRREM